jgi:hypothetical protein
MLTDLVSAVSKAGRITAEDVLAFRKAYYHDGRITPVEADAIFTANTACKEAHPSWSVFFSEALCDYTVHQMQPHGHVNADNAAWLMSHIDRDGRVDSATELDLLVAILEQAKTVPETLAAYALAQVKHAVISGTGPLRSGKTLLAGVVDEADVELLRRILFAYAGGGNIAVTSAEADVLFDINDATAKGSNHPAWQELFAKAIANHLMFASNHAPVSREEALRRDAWVSDTSTSVGGFVTSMVKTLRDIYRVANFKETDTQRQRREAYFGAMRVAEDITEPEARWLTDRITRDGHISEAERAALLFIKQEAAHIHPSLAALLDKVA